MSHAAVAVLEPVGAGRIALEAIDIQARLRGLFSEVTVSQTYRNLEAENIEAVYTFPVPLDAVLLELTLEINGKVLKGVVQPRAEAESSYEDAIDDGDSAVLLQQAGPGLYMMNLGNLLPEETAVIRFRYAQIHHWQGDSLRFHLPTTIAPRYGDPVAAGLSPHEVPEYTLAANYGFSFKVRIEGSLARANIDCPTHPIAVTSVEGCVEISLSAGTQATDRDLILVLRESVSDAGQGLWGPDSEAGFVALASFHPSFTQDAPAVSRCIKLIVDCSGSMGGDSIAQAKAALREILQLLKPTDYFSLTAFGSHFHQVFPEPVIARDDSLALASQFIEHMDANMGGTEIGAALEATYDMGTASGLPTDNLLITDGEVWDHESLIVRAQQSGHRFFVVGVGSAVSEAFVRQLAETTGGACELVSPREGIAERIVRHFQRINQPKAISATIHWPGEPLQQYPEQPGAVYSGDTLNVFGWFAEAPSGPATLALQLDDGRTVEQNILLEADQPKGAEWDDSVARVGAQARLASLTSEEARALAVKYQLITEHTSCILVHEREADQKAVKVPALRKVPQTLAAGWGGTGTVLYECADLDRPTVIRKSRAKNYEAPASMEAEMEYIDIPAFLRKAGENQSSIEELVKRLNKRYPMFKAARLDRLTLADLESLGLPSEAIEALKQFLSPDVSEQALVISFLQALEQSASGRRLSRHVRRLIRKAVQSESIPSDLAEDLAEIFD